MKTSVLFALFKYFRENCFFFLKLHMFYLIFIYCFINDKKTAQKKLVLGPGVGKPCWLSSRTPLVYLLTFKLIGIQVKDSKYHLKWLFCTYANIFIALCFIALELLLFTWLFSKLSQFIIKNKTESYTFNNIYLVATFWLSSAKLILFY